MRLLFVGYLHGFGGAERMLIMLSNAMAERNHDVMLLGLAENNPCYPISDKVQYAYCEDKGKSTIYRIVHRYKSLKQKIRDYNPDLVVHFNLQSAYLSAFMGKRVCQKTIYCERGDPYDKEYNGVLGVLRTITCKRIKGFVFQTIGARNFFNEHVRRRSCIIHNPVFINPADYPPRENREKRIVTVGRLSEQKNQKLLIEAVAKLPESLYEYKVEVYGEGPLQQQLEHQIQEMGLADRVFLMGAFSDIHERIRNAALFVLTSDYEGMPNALLEALAMGLPSVSTDCRPGGAKELIKNGIGGIIVPCGDADALALAMAQILSDDKLAVTFGKAGQQVAQVSQPGIIYSKWEQFFFVNIKKDKIV